MSAQVFDDRQCTLGEGPLWHPERQQLFWFDIVGHKLMTRVGDAMMEWEFDEYVSAAGWVDYDTLLVASETGLYSFDLTTGESMFEVSLEIDNPVTRSNDGRADPMGGFWIGTMGKNAEPGAGAIYRYYQGELRKLFADITISNSICFAPSGALAYFCDTVTAKIMQVTLDAEGWPNAKPTVFVDLGEEGLNPDGSVVDASGHLWNAQWGAHRVACYDPQGQFVQAITFDAEQVSCPAFGGPDMTQLFATSAAEGVTGKDEGKTFVARPEGHIGQTEHQVIL